MTYAEHLFAEGTVNEINIEIDEADWEDILENPLEEEYHRANITINGETINNVAIRTKGNTSLTSVANSDSDRYSFKVDFDYYTDGGNYYGMKKLCLNNNYADDSNMREYIAYKIMGELGLPTVGCGYSHITVNGEEWGLYLAVEPVDEVFLQTRFADASGDLYKPEGMDGTGADLVYRGDDISEYTALNLKTNTETSDGTEIIALMKALESGEGLTDVLDVDNALKYIAANVALANFDSYLGFTTHNYYLYEENGVFSVIPWDLNLAFGGFGGGTVDIYEPASQSMGGGPGGGRPDDAQQPQEMQQEAAAQTDSAEATVADAMPTAMEQGAPDGQTPPEMPNGQNGGNAPDGQTPPDLPNGQNGGSAPDGQTPPDLPDGQNGGSAPDGQTPPDLSNGQNGGNAPDGQTPPEMPNGQNGGNAPAMPNGEDAQNAQNAPEMGDFADMPGMPSMGSGEKPLVTTLLENEEYLAQYEGYLKQIAENYLTEDYMTALVTQIHDLIAPYVAQDATAFCSYEEFEQACSVDPTDPYSLVYYAVNMSESIENQLAGGEPTFDTSSMQGGGMGGFGGGERPDRPERGENAENAGSADETAAEGKQPQENGEEQQAMAAFAGKGGGDRPNGMPGGPGMPGDFAGRSVDIKQYLPMMLLCGGAFAAGAVVLLCFKRKRELKPPKAEM